MTKRNKEQEPCILNINLSGQRGKDEPKDVYRCRRKLVNIILKEYFKQGRYRRFHYKGGKGGKHLVSIENGFKSQYPNGVMEEFKDAIKELT